MNESQRTLCEQLNAQAELSEQLAERNLETPTRFIARVNNETRYTGGLKKVYVREPFSIEFQIKAYERALKMYKR